MLLLGLSRILTITKIDRKTTHIYKENDRVLTLTITVSMSNVLNIRIQKNDSKYHLLTLHRVAFCIFIKKNATSSSVLLRLKDSNASLCSVLLGSCSVLVCVLAGLKHQNAIRFDVFFIN